MSRTGTRTSNARRGRANGNGNGRSSRPRDNEGIIPVLARTVREVEGRVRRGSTRASDHATFQAIALLAREERARVKSDKSLGEAHVAEQLKRLDGIGTILATTAALNPAFFDLLADDAVLSSETLATKRQMQAAAGFEAEAASAGDEPGTDVAPETDRRVVPRSVAARKLARPFLAPDFSGAASRRQPTGALASWELLGPLFRSFEEASGGAPSCMSLPEPVSLTAPGGKELMKHQAEVVAAASAGHRTFLLADEPGLGKTAQALLAAQAADAYPLLAVVPNVVKMNWAHEAGMWVPRRAATVIHGDGHDLDGFADIIVVNYEVLDRHADWLGDFGFGSMVVDEAHFIKNRSSQRSQHVLRIAEQIRAKRSRPLMMALTGTPLINDIEDFRAIWQFLGWIDQKRPRPELMAKLEETGLTPLDRAFYPAARQAVIDMGIVRRRKVDVAADIPARRIADLPVELDGEVGRSIREAERELARRLVARYDRVLAARSSESGETVEGIDHALARQVATWERDESSEEGSSEENVFAMVRRIGQAKATLAADYAAQLARNVGKVVFFAKHIDVMDAAEQLFAERGLRSSSIRGDQTTAVRQRNIEAFVNDPDVPVIVCSLTAAGVGVNLQVASNVVLAELSWTDAEQTQAIDRVHRIGQGDPVTAWRVIAAQTIDARIAELIDSKAGLAA
ncbi:MAG: DEAD/DEAH box helicase, partial [Marmoricola sp.]|nr:DEAD/DEAH box helicase [Marmoricola sp.]